MIVKIPRAYLKALTSDLLKGEVKLTFQMPLNTETMELRANLAMLHVLDEAVTLEIKSPQGALPETSGGDAGGLADSDTTVTLSALGQSVTMTGERFSELAEGHLPKRD